MAIAQTHSGLDVVLDAVRTFFQHQWHQILTARAKRSVYLETLHELSALTDRDLSDLGIVRENIKSIALEAAHGA